MAVKMFEEPLRLKGVSLVMQKHKKLFIPLKFIEFLKPEKDRIEKVHESFKISLRKRK